MVLKNALSKSQIVSLKSHVGYMKDGNIMSWRLQGQEKYLGNKQLIKVDIYSFKNKM